MRYRLFGHTMVTVTVEVTADSEKDAYAKAAKQLPSLNAYAGNGGIDKLVGVEGNTRTVNADENIEYDDIEPLG